ncbi:MAG: hypothetical protein D6800_07255 [Candidatus Zixiibacteriota bacterium]|nr:MAG: hypothetical protein D6800_07255 [candidate division Zixibacteria bacterium]
MDVRDPKTQKMLIAGLAFFIIAYFWYARVFSRYEAQINTKTQEFETITTNLRSVEMKAKSLDALKAEYEELTNRYGEIEALLPEVKQIPSLLVQLHTASSLTGTRITKIEPQPINGESFYNIASFRIKMVGGYHEFGKFISYVANFPFIANISDMKLETIERSRQLLSRKKDDKEANKKKETLVAEFTLSTYFVKEGERLKDVTL